MLKLKRISNFFKQNIFLLPFFIIPGFLSYTIYTQDIKAFYAVMENNEKQVLEFQERLIIEHLKSLEEDITYISSHFRTSEFVNSNFNPKYDLSLIYSSFLKRRNIYSSIRIIDSGGFEQFRMDSDGTNIKNTAREDLQSKGNRYYFNEIINKNPGEIYFSKLDFNYEGGKLQYPYEPVLRVAELVVDKNENKRAFVILNYRGSDVFKLIDNNSQYSFGNIFLKNKEDLIISLDAALSSDKTEVMDYLSTNQGKIFLKKDSDQINLAPGFISYKKIKISNTDLSPKWTLISYVGKSKIQEHTVIAFNRSLSFFAFLSFLGFIVAFFAYRNKKIRVEANLLIVERAKIFDLNPAPVLKTTYNGEILSSNIAAKTILGLTTKPPSIYKVFNKLDKNEINNIHSNSINNFEYQIKNKTYFITSIIEPTRNQIFFYGTDITENYKIREDLKNFQTAVKQSANVIVFTDLEGRVLFANDAFEKVTGYSSEEVLGNKPAVLNSGYHSNSFYDELWDTIKNGNVWAGEFYNKRKDGTFFWEKATISPVLNKEGNPVFFIAVKEDITEKKEIEEKLQIQTKYAETERINADKARIEAESANILKSSFLANMSHEIRTPMNAILGFTRLLLDKEMHKKDRDMLEIIMNSGMSLLTLINDILDFSKIEANEIEISKVKINLGYFFDSIEDLFKIQTSQKNLNFTVSLSNNIPKIVFGDENRIRQILINVIGNAIKFTESGSISIKANWIDNKLNIAVKDTGIGIAKDKIGEIFSPFKQSDSSTDRKYEGTGLGLAISLRLTEMMNGELNVESSIDNGSTFNILLPLEPCKENDQIFNNKEQESIKLNNSKVIVEGWLKKVENDKVLTSIVRDAIADLPRNLERLNTAILSNNFKPIAGISHELMGSTGNMGMLEIYELLKDINIGIKNKNITINEIKNIYVKLQEIIIGIPTEFLQEFASELLPVEGDIVDINILTADDSSVNRLLIEAMLSSIYVKSDFAENGIEVLDKLKNKKYDILLLDIQMPQMDGIETIKHIRENEEYKDLYVIAVTANAMRGDAQKYLDLGCNDYISKPIQKDIFLKKIEHQIQSKTKFSELEVKTPDLLEIDKIISLLEQETKIFNPGRVIKVAESLEQYKSNRKISKIIDSLKNTADSFDSQGLNNIIAMFMELQENENDR